MQKKLIPVLILLVLSFILSACAGPIIGAATDERSFGEHINDTQIEASVKAAIVGEQASKILDINVYSFYGNIYLIGEADRELSAKVINVSKRVNGVRSVTTSFYPPGASTSQDILTEIKVNESLLMASGVPSAKVQVDVWTGQAHLLGILANQEQMDKVLATVRNVPEVKSIKNYMMLN